MGKEKSVVRGILAGIAGGLAATWVMNQFLAGPAQKPQHAAQSDAENREQQAQVLAPALGGPSSEQRTRSPSPR
jgi:hypothetical protein